jgi:hypothetical protein
MTMEKALQEINGMVFPAKQDGDILWYPQPMDNNESYKFICINGEWEHQPE